MGAAADAVSGLGHACVGGGGERCGSCGGFTGVTTLITLLAS
ncbi:hypothetical protein SBD_1163 [Streptomyces bottropensis ATCC 25435]|uniref:Uncharacterized protein n=1 Tax=Streptomyces bottropensis ATCC 25435 TaxID=1054862 RepID=M3EPQ7_9ACTN|nr:hypothetical protein SBD_1163 [Streptomyces bottropensis ATCC 25435]